MFFFYTNPILIAAAVIPAIFLLVHVYRADKLEKEPAPLLISLVLYGITATFIALILERLGSAVLGQFFPEDSVPYNIIMYFGVVAFSEEGAKYFLLKRRTWNSAGFNCQFDGVVYAVFVALGFVLGGTVGAGTIAAVFLTGPLVQFWLPITKGWIVRVLPEPAQPR